jgi:hypothetical protein
MTFENQAAKLVWAEVAGTKGEPQIIFALSRGFAVSG